MGFRYQRRIPIIGGLGLNLSKSGVGLSFRTLFGTVGTKGYSIRTGIPGLSWRAYQPKGGGSGAALLWAILLLPFVIYALIWVCLAIFWVIVVVGRLIYYGARYVYQLIHGHGSLLPVSEADTRPAASRPSPVSDPLTTLLFKCHACGHQYSAERQLSGLAVRCSNCSHEMTVPHEFVDRYCSLCARHYKVPLDCYSEEFRCESCHALLDTALEGVAVTQLPLRTHSSTPGLGSVTVVPPPLPVLSAPRKPVLTPSSISEATIRSVVAPAPYQLPPLSLLTPPLGRDCLQQDAEEIGRVIVRTLAEGFIQAKLKDVVCSTLAFRFEISTAKSIRLEQVLALRDSLAAVLRSTGLEISTPSNGDAGIFYIDAPNQHRVVFLRAILESKAWQPDQQVIPILLGLDSEGNYRVGDLDEMQNILVCGSSGSGKSVFLNSVLAGFLISRTPWELQLLLIDTKRLEFAPYNYLPHLWTHHNEVITDTLIASRALESALREMERRLKLMALVGVKTIQEYNARQIQTPVSENPKHNDDSVPPHRLPYIVIVIDEVADIMATARRETTDCLIAIAEHSRITGIHLILSTQGPLRSVLGNGLRDSFASRVAFRVANRNESRFVLGNYGAETLLGRGDMLVQALGTFTLFRAQSGLSPDDELRRIADYITAQRPPDVNDPQLQYAVGMALANGTFGKSDPEEAVKWLRLSAARGQADAQFELGVAFAHGTGVVQDWSQALKFFQEAAAQGHPASQYNLGVAYDTGDGVDKNPTVAVEWFHKAAQQNDADAQYALGVAYANGEGVVQDAAQAFTWYLRAAQQGHADAQCDLGVACAQGEGTDKNTVAAVQWFHMAAQQGHPQAQYNLGFAYASGEGVSQDNQQAVIWFRKAASQGDADAQLELGAAYVTGCGVKKNLAEAIKWYRKSAEQGHAAAQFRLANAYASGQGVSMDPQQASLWYRKSADQGDPDAAFALGKAYFNGEGVEKDIAEAHAWLLTRLSLLDPVLNYFEGMESEKGQCLPGAEPEKGLW